MHPARTLDNVRVASPCKASWAEMVGDERVRFCGQCDRSVYNLSALTRVEAEALVAESEGRRCVRFFQRADGTMLTADCPEGVREKRVALVKLGTRALGLTAMLAGAALAPLVLERPENEPVASVSVRPPRVMMGEVAPTRTPLELMGKIAMPAPKRPPRELLGDLAMDD